jgi:hypothetical protein
MDRMRNSDQSLAGGNFQRPFGARQPGVRPAICDSLVGGKMPRGFEFSLPQRPIDGPSESPEIVQEHHVGNDIAARHGKLFPAG